MIMENIKLDRLKFHCKNLYHSLVTEKDAEDFEYWFNTYVKDNETLLMNKGYYRSESSPSLDPNFVPHSYVVVVAYSRCLVESKNLKDDQKKFYPTFKQTIFKGKQMIEYHNEYLYWQERAIDSRMLCKKIFEDKSISYIVKKSLHYIKDEANQDLFFIRTHYFPPIDDQDKQTPSDDFKRINLNDAFFYFVDMVTDDLEEDFYDDHIKKIMDEFFYIQRGFIEQLVLYGILQWPEKKTESELGCLS